MCALHFAIEHSARPKHIGYEGIHRCEKSPRPFTLRIDAAKMFLLNRLILVNLLQLLSIGLSKFLGDGYSNGGILSGLNHHFPLKERILPAGCTTFQVQCISASVCLQTHARQAEPLSGAII